LICVEKLKISGILKTGAVLRVVKKWRHLAWAKSTMLAFSGSIPPANFVDVF
jgi:hypothetical protein